MEVARRHRWNLTTREAVALQQRLADKVSPKLAAPLPDSPLVAGADVSYDNRTDKLFAAVVVMRWPDGKIVEQVTLADRARFPYVPGLLSFREAPAVLRCFRKLKCRPDVVMMDGQGLAHPRRFGLACHIGWLLNLPAIGCAKSILVGHYANLGKTRGATTPLLYHEETVGCALRTRIGVRPVFVSVGHRIDLATATGLVLACATRYRLPEPTRQAHILVNKTRMTS